MECQKIKSDAWNPQQYEKFKNERSKPFFDLMALIDPVKDPYVVDLGCGTGELTVILHNHVEANFTMGMDSSSAMLAKAKAFANTKIDFTQGLIEKFYQPNTVDIIFSNAAMQWCVDHRTLLKNFKESLRPGGQLLIQMPMNHDYPTHTLAIQMSMEEPWHTMLKGESYTIDKSMLSAVEYATELFNLGFQEQNVFVKVYGHVLDSREGVVEWVSGTTLTHFKSRMNSSDYAEFLKSYKSRLFHLIPDTVPYFYPFKRIFLKATNT